MSAEIIKPFGNYNTPDVPESVISNLEKLLERAMRGEIKGFAIGYIDGADNVKVTLEQGSAGFARIVGAASIMQHDLCVAWNDS